MPSQHDYGPCIDDAIQVRVLQIMRTQITPENWCISTVCSSFWRLYFNATSGASLRIDGEKLPLKAGEWWIIPAWLTFDCHCTKPVDHTCIHFDLPGLPAKFVEYVCNRPTRVERRSVDERFILDLHRSLKRDGINGLTPVLRSKVKVFQALANLADRDLRISPFPWLTALGERHGLAPALQLVEQNISGPITNSDLARVCHLSESQLVRRFRQIMQQTPAAYVAERRVSLASLALAFESDSIEVIADRFGFANRYHFSRVFRRHMGVPPGAYRRQPLV